MTRRGGAVWHLAVRLTGWYAILGALARHPGVSCPKVFRGVKRGLFSKSPLLRVSFTAFSFCFFFFCAGAPGKPNPIRRGGIFFTPAAHRSLGIFYMPAVVLLAGGKKYSPHGASQFFALQKTEWFRLTGCSLKRKRRAMKSDKVMEK